MLATISMALPILLVEGFLVIRQKDKAEWVTHLFLFFLKYVVFNYTLIAAIQWFYHREFDLIYYMNHEIKFAVKYSALLFILSVLAVVITKLQQRLWKTSIILETLFESNVYRVALIIVAVVILAVQVPRLNNISFWADERFTIRLVQNDIWGIIQGTALDVHPPLYYLIVHALCEIFGYNAVSYHLASFIPMVLYMALILTLGWKKLGGISASFLVLLGGLLQGPLRYDMEARMYSWGLFLIAASYLAFYCVLETGRAKEYAFFGIATILAAYTHYYCLLNVSFLYLTLIILAIIQKQSRKKVIVTSLVAILSYAPWMVVFLQSYARTTDGNYWIDKILSWRECNEILFSGSLQQMLVPLMAIFGAYGVYRSLAEGEHKKAVFLLTGFLTVYGTIGLALGVSYLISPLIFDRYLLPVAFVAWTVMAVGVSASKHRFEIAVVLLTGLLVTGIGELQSAIRVSETLNRKGTEFLNYVHTEFDEQTVLLNAAYYGQEDYIADVQMQGIVIEDLENFSFDEANTYYITVYKYEVEAMENALATQGRKAEAILPSCSLGDGSFALYRLVK